eukprot:scaffold15501_cov40-Phaeocystis_antarctica.AAC.2
MPTPRYSTRLPTLHQYSTTADLLAPSARVATASRMNRWTLWTTLLALCCCSTHALTPGGVPCGRSPVGSTRVARGLRVDRRGVITINQDSARVSHHPRVCR